MKEEKNQNSQSEAKAKKSSKALAEIRNTFASTTALIISSLTLVAGLAWNDVAKTVFENLKEKLSGWGQTIGQVLYAIVVTVIVVIIVQRLRKIQKAVGGETIK